MRRILLLFFLITHIHIFAQSVSKQNVVNYAKLWLDTYNQNIQVSNIETIKIQNEITLYLVHLNPKGFIIFSADSRVKPILAYSFKNDFILNDNISPEVKYLIQEYSNQVLLIKHNRFANLPDLWHAHTQSRFYSQNSVSPLLTSNWNQGSGYNQYCPSDSNGPGGHVWAGCIATAGAQILNYWQQPTHGYGEYSYIDDTYGLQSVVYENVNYDWTGMQNGNMQDIALLMYHVAVSVKMDFGVDGSSAYMSDLVSAFHNIFQYNAEILRRQDYSTNDWINIIKTELDNNRPIVYEGTPQSQNGGHAWVCDGYDNNNLFHMNWGWGGNYNGYYSIDDLTPGPYNYNSNQYIIKNIEPSQTFVCNNDENEQGNNNIGINNDNFREGAYLDENFNSITACLSPGDKDWYTISYQYNGEIENIDILVKGANANTSGPYNISMTKNGNILTIETHPVGRYTDTFIQWKCMCDNGNLPTLIMEDDNSGANGMYSKLVIDLDQIDRTYVPDFNFMEKLYFDRQVSNNIFSHHFFTAYAQNFTILEVNYSNIDDLTGIEAFSNLQELWCHHNNLTSLDVSQNHNLTKLVCRQNNLQTLAINPELHDLIAMDNNLTNLDLSNIQDLHKVYLNNNNLVTLNMSGINTNNINNFYVTGNPNLSCIILDDYINANKGIGIYGNWHYDNQVTFTRDDCSQQTYIPDANFENALINLGYDLAFNHYTPTSNIDLVNSINLSNKNISNITGINDFSQLQVLNLNNNYLTSPDISSLNLLQELQIANNNLNNIDLSNLSNLTFLNLAGNNITNLDISNNQLLNNLNISNNQLTSIDISNNSLQNINCSFNQIQAIDFSNNTNLMNINVSNNLLSDFNLQNGQNTNIINFYAQNNPNLTCIFVDDANYSTQNWTNIDANTHFVETQAECDAFLGVDDIDFTDNINVSPNPTNKILNIENPNNYKIKQAKIYNLQGQQILKFNDNFEHLDVSNLPKGMYILELQTEEKENKARFKFIKE